MQKKDIFQNKNDHAFVASLSDGSVVTMHYYKNKHVSWGQPELCWGLSSKRNKIKLPQPVCDLSLIDYGNDGNSIVTCLRDGSVFVIPVTPMNHDNKEQERDLNIALYKLPKISDNNSSSLSSNIDDLCKPYTQGFTSAYVRVKDLLDGGGLDQIPNEKGRMVLLIFHAWAGGLIDCHYCNLLPNRLPTFHTKGQMNKIQDNNKQLNFAWSRILADHGVLEELVSFLLSLDLNNNRLLNKNSTVLKAALECKSLGTTLGEVVDAITTNCSDHHQLESFSKLVDDLVFGAESKDSKFYMYE